MKIFDYQKICQDLLGNLPERQKEVISRRFGLKRETPPTYQLSGKTGFGETLEAIGQDFGLTRERVRQIGKEALLEVKPKITGYQKVLQYFKQYLKRCGGLRKEEILLSDLGGEKERARVYFLLTISGDFERFNENEDFYSFWVINSDYFKKTKETIERLLDKLKEIGRPLSLKEMNSFFSPAKPTLPYYLEISKKISQNDEGLYGLKDWPEINPRGVKNKAYFVLKKLGRPLHFKEITRSIEGALVQTVHNELIKDSRFILVGRGIYALKEWGYIPGHVKDVITQILKENGPLTKKEILEKTLRQRMIKENTALLNLSNKKYFSKTPQGKYIVRET